MGAVGGSLHVPFGFVLFAFALYAAHRYAAHRYEFGFVRDGVVAVQVCLARLRGFAVAVRHHRENTHGDEVDMGAVRGRAWHSTLHFGTRPGRWVSQAATGDLHQILARRIVEVVLVGAGGCGRDTVEQLLACGEEHRSEERRVGKECRSPWA